MTVAEEALAAYRQSRPDDAIPLIFALNALGRMHLGAEQFDKAEVAYREAITLHRASSHPLSDTTRRRSRSTHGWWRWTTAAISSARRPTPGAWRSWTADRAETARGTGRRAGVGDGDDPGRPGRGDLGASVSDARPPARPITRRSPLVPR
ncbi:MAG: tetratricopeptide repeat protein [bacterium]|nr:tetratricopeptide repeat protein [bacterium]